MNAHRHPRGSGLTLIAAVLLIVAPAAAAQAADAEPAIASEQLGGTILAVQPRVASESAALRVAGPEGYSLSRTFDGAPITVDLLADAEPRVAADQQLAVEDAQWESLPDGRYTYEVVFASSGRRPLVHTGAFYAEGGSLVSLETMRARGVFQDGGAAAHGDAGTSPGVTSATEEFPEPAPITDADDHINIFDTQGDGQTNLHLDSDLGNSWHFRSEDGDLHWVEFSPITPRMALIQGGNLGIGTTAPQSPLHVDSSAVGQIRLGFGAGNSRLWAGFTGLWFLDSAGQNIVQFNHSASPNALVVSGPSVGIHTPTPAQDFHLTDGPDANGNGSFRISTASHSWDFASIQNTGTFRISKLGTGAGEFDLAPGGNLVITGSLTTGGTTCGGGGCDLVFSDGYELNSIDEHATEMWSNRHLPAVGPTAESQPFNITEKVGGMLHELEMAHIYIEQLHQRLEEKATQLAHLQMENTTILTQLQRIEERLAADSARP